MTVMCTYVHWLCIINDVGHKSKTRAMKSKDDRALKMHPLYTYLPLLRTHTCACTCWNSNNLYWEAIISTN